MGRRLRLILGLVLAVALGLHAERAAADTEVDLALVLAVDISNSMDPEEQALQREGFVDAFRSPLVHDAIRSGAVGRIAVIYAEWAGTWTQNVLVPWTVIDGPDSAKIFADRLAAKPITRAPRTSVSGAIDFGVRLLGESGVEPTRRVIDISGDGANNQGRSVTQARDEAVAKGITINGLPILMKRSSGYWDVADLDVYYRDCVIGGQGAFMVPVRDKDQFPQAVKTKIILEIAGLTPPEPLVKPAQMTPSTCLAGEAWRERWGN
jgi:Protein of unknown function (DUF1194)